MYAKIKFFDDVEEADIKENEVLDIDLDINDFAASEIIGLEEDIRCYIRDILEDEFNYAFSISDFRVLNLDDIINAIIHRGSIGESFDDVDSFEYDLREIEHLIEEKAREICSNREGSDSYEALKKALMNIREAIHSAYKMR